MKVLSGIANVYSNTRVHLDYNSRRKRDRFTKTVQKVAPNGTSSQREVDVIFALSTIFIWLLSIGNDGGVDDANHYLTQ